MKIVFIHGENLIRGRDRFYQIIEYVKAKGKKIKNISLDENLDLAEILTAQSLFEEEILYTISETKKIPLKKLSWIFQKSDKLQKDILFLYEGPAPISIIKILPKKAKVEKYDIPKIIFKFLESFYPKNAKESLLLLRQLTQNEPLEFVFFLLTRHLRDLYWVLQTPGPDYPSWRLGKLKSQAGKFSKGALEEIIKSLSELDIKVKTSQTQLASSLDLIMIRELE